jgi:ribonuclease D
MLKPIINKEEINKLPLEAFNGKITIVDSQEKVTEAMNILQKQTVVGIDTETKPSFRKGTINKIALLQIATEDHCMLFRLNKIPFPEELVDFLSDKKIKKIGLALKDDLNGLNKHYKFNPENIIDLQSIVKSYGIFELSLQKIYAILFEKRISKSQRLTNWENDTLTEHQQIYAATDAWSTLLIYNRLMQEKKLTKKEIEAIEQSIANDIKSHDL